VSAAWPLTLTGARRTRHYPKDAKPAEPAHGHSIQARSERFPGFLQNAPEYGEAAKLRQALIRQGLLRARDGARNEARKCLIQRE
jgi:hypothetical protein